MNRMIQSKTATCSVLILVGLSWIWVAPKAQAVNPAPDGGYPGFNTAEGQNALFNLSTGVGNAAVGWFSLSSNTDGSYNTAVGVRDAPFQRWKPEYGRRNPEHSYWGCGALIQYYWC